MMETLDIKKSRLLNQLNSQFDYTKFDYIEVTKVELSKPARDKKFLSSINWKKLF